MRATKAVAALAAVAALVLPQLGGGDPDRAAAAAGADRQRPNIVVVMSDDQTLEEMRFMPRTERLLGSAGATFPDTTTNWPICCPSRATFFTGQYAHNHGVLGNSAPMGGYGNLDVEHTLPVWLQRSGYSTIHIGKFVNGYETSGVGVPPGWSEWHGSKRTYAYYGYQLFEAGEVLTYGSLDEDPDDPAEPASYSTDVYTDKAVRAIDERAPSAQPFFLSVSYLAPHAGEPEGGGASRCADTAKPALRHAGLLDDEPLPVPPSFNEADVSDKPRPISRFAPMTPEQIARTTKNYRCRGESLLAIDEGVKRIVAALRASGELRDTLLIYTSDNGFFHGEHRIGSGKNRVYEEAVRVPLLIRGPGIPRGVEVADIAGNADIAATIAAAAGARPDHPLDGRSLLGFAEHPERLHGRELLIEQDAPTKPNGNPRGTEYQAVRTSRYKFVRYWDNQVELYDIRRDPYELENLRADPAYDEVRQALAQRLEKLGDCAGKSCRTKPALRLKLPEPVRKDGAKCRTAGDFVASVRRRGDGSAPLVRVSFRVAGQPSGTVRSAPFKQKLNSRLLRSERKPLIEADGELIDGRILTLTDRVRICR
jgi:arylsulfatase A-like enzyme